MEASFVDLRRLSDWLSSPRRSALQLDRLLDRLGTTAVPLLGRALRDPARREAARDALGQLAEHARDRVVGELRTIADDPACADDGKVCALGLLSELGEKGEARFTDPHAIQRRSALALAAQLDTAADVANTADMMLRQLDDDDIGDMLDVMAEVAAPAATRLAGELAGRLDASAELRARVVSHSNASITEIRRRERPTRVAVLVDAAARLVVVATRKIAGERAWRRWAVLIGASGRIDDCIHTDDVGADGDAAPLIANLVADGYQVASTELDHARALVGAAAKLTASERGAKLTSAYYLGRDLLDLGNAHLDGCSRVELVASTLGRAVDLIAAGDHARALSLLQRCDEAQADVAAAIAACLIAQGRTADAIPHLVRAADAEKEFALHHWNLAAALHAAGDVAGCERALKQFLATSVASSGLAADDAQPERIALARRLVKDFERVARLEKPRRRKSRRVEKTR